MWLDQTPERIWSRLARVLCSSLAIYLDHFSREVVKHQYAIGVNDAAPASGPPGSVKTEEILEGRRQRGNRGCQNRLEVGEKEEYQEEEHDGENGVQTVLKGGWGGGRL